MILRFFIYHCSTLVFLIFMLSFSQRHGHSPLKQAFQRESMDSDLRIKLWNLLNIFIWKNYPQYIYKEKIDDLVARLWFHFFNYDYDHLPKFNAQFRSGNTGYDILKDQFFDLEWFKVYDFIEAIVNDPSSLLSEDNKITINNELEKHNSAYRLVENKIIEITDQIEIDAIEDALKISDDPVKEHLNTSLEMLSDKESKDYRNSIKESISAVESICRTITGKNTLPDSLRGISDLHPSLKSGLSALYGYTSDEAGIRHALTDDSSPVSYAEAKFMLVACSAFVSYLKQKYQP